MDAYVVVAGGTEAVHEIQQWLNSRYVATRRDFFIIPCDGIFSRDVQKALYYAIQFELGYNDDQATGVFGPNTRAGLKAHTLSTGSSGIFVSIFSAALKSSPLWRSPVRRTTPHGVRRWSPPVTRIGRAAPVTAEPRSPMHERNPSRQPDTKWLAGISTQRWMDQEARRFSLAS
jgi:hypothetical protein